MLPYFWYILKVIICSGILFGYYWLFLRNKVFHQYNRFYLLAALALSLLLPLVKIDFWQNSPQQSQVIRALQVVSAGDDYMNNVIITANKNNWSVQQLYPVVYWMVSLIFFLVLLQTVFVIRSLLKKYPVQIIDKFSFVNTDYKSTPFSFLKYIFWNTNIDMDTVTGKQIFKHEVAHIQEKHTYDKLFVNIILIFFWCNPFFWLYRKELNMIHEFIADKKAVEDSDTASFAAMILQATYPQHRFQLANNFFYSPIKRRLFMLTKNNNPKVNYFARVMVLPLAILIFAAFTFKAKSDTSFYHGKKITVVIDAGHGGEKDPGARSADGILEKDLTLAIAKKIKELNSNNAIEIILTRNEDVYMSPRQKAEFAKSKNADLVISFHIDNGPDGSANTKTGMSVFVAKDEFPNSRNSTILASAIISEFRNNYGLAVMPQPTQRQKSVILQANDIPSVLVEAGYINNSKDVAYLETNKAKETIAKNVLVAIEKFASSVTQSKTFQSNVLNTDTTPSTMLVNVKHADIKYLKTDEFQNKALVIVDSKEIGNVGNDYIEKGNERYSSIIVYNPVEARKIYGEKGSYGAIKLTLKDVVSITADSVFYDEKNKSIKLSGTNTTLTGDLANTLIYVDHKIVTPVELNAIQPSKISSINILKGEKIDEIIEAKGKTAVIYVSLKPADLAEVVVTGVLRKDQTPAVVTQGSLLRETVVTPKLYFGDVTGSRAEVEFFKKQKEIRVSVGYSFVSAQVWFSGAGFPNVVSVDFSGNSLNPIRQYLDKCVGGSVVTFDNIKASDADGKEIIIDGRSFALYSIDANTNRFTTQPEKPAMIIETPVKPDNTQNRAITVIGEQVPQPRENNNIVFTKAEVSPEFTGGQEAWRNYLVKNLKASTPVDEGWGAGKYTVIVKFIVHTDGTVSDVTTENYKNTKTALESIRIIKNSPKWQPAVQNGHKVNAYKKQPIIFLIEEQ